MKNLIEAIIISLILTAILFFLILSTNAHAGIKSLSSEGSITFVDLNKIDPKQMISYWQVSPSKSHLQIYLEDASDALVKNNFKDWNLKLINREMDSYELVNYITKVYVDGTVMKVLEGNNPNADPVEVARKVRDMIMEDKASSSLHDFYLDIPGQLEAIGEQKTKKELDAENASDEIRRKNDEAIRKEVEVLKQILKQIEDAKTLSQRALSRDELAQLAQFFKDANEESGRKAKAILDSAVHVLTTGAMVQCSSEVVK